MLNFLKSVFLLDFKNSIYIFILLYPVFYNVSFFIMLSFLCFVFTVYDYSIHCDSAFEKAFMNDKSDF